MCVINENLKHWSIQKCKESNFLFVSGSERLTSLTAHARRLVLASHNVWKKLLESNTREIS